MKNMREILDESNQILKDPKWKDKQTNGLYLIPTIMYLIWNAIFTLITIGGFLEIKGPTDLAIIIFVGLVSLILSVRYIIYGFVYSKTKEISVGEYILRTVPGLFILIMLPFVADILRLIYSFLG
ncbi:prenyltransferase [Bacillus cereus group sp. BfR-BA-01329]|uniref:prenyltransferase n=1 Tax=Bacillus cereus group sp. BfR-BA-01329 TaxID=2920305 RepID=UPI001F56FE41|nr:prenyltransferase [Bacillus cereus group sp. BfR-BA-01329]